MEEEFHAAEEFHATVEEVRDLTHDVREIVLKLTHPKDIHFKAGQFISIELTRPGTDHPIIRPYSIASPPHQTDRITLVFNRIPGGVGSTYLFSLQPGSPISFKGPAGLFYVRDMTRDCLFVATGTGVAPIRSMIHDLMQQPYRGSLTLLWGLRSQRDLYYQEEFTSLAARRSQTSFIITLSRPESGWQGAHGRVTTYVQHHMWSVKNLAVYLCGNHAMINEVTEYIRTKGLCPIYREIYYDDPTSKPDD